MKTKQFKYRFFILIGGINLIVLVVLAGIIYSQTSKNIKAKLFEEAKTVVYQQVRGIEKTLEDGLTSSQSLSLMAEASMSMQESNRRSIFIKQMKNVSKQSQNVMCTWAVFEPNLFDGLDASNTHSEGADQSGVFVPILTKTKDGLNLMSEISYAKESRQEYFSLPKTAGTDMILRSNHQLFGSKNANIVSVSSPMIHKDKFVGVTGLDISLESLADIFKNIETTSGFRIDMLNSDMGMVFHQWKGKDGKNITELTKEMTEWITQVKKTKKNDLSTLTAKGLSERAGDYNLIVPLQVGRLDFNWMFLLSVPESLIESRLAYGRNIIMEVGFILFILSLALTFFVGQYFLRMKSRFFYEISKLKVNIKAGQLSARANTEGVLDELVPIMQEINEIVAETETQANNISRGLLRMIEEGKPEHIAQQSKGSFGVIEQNINSIINTINKHAKKLQAMSIGDMICIDETATDNNILATSLTGLQTSLRKHLDSYTHTCQSLSEGDWTVRLDTDQLEGNYLTTAENFNNALDSILNPMEESTKALKGWMDTLSFEKINIESKGQSEEHLNLINIIGETLNEFEVMSNKIAAEARKVMDAVSLGQLNVRAELEDENQIKQSVLLVINEMMDALSKPILTTSNAMKEMANGNWPELIEEKFEGDFEEMINLLNQLVTTNKDQAKIAQAIADGNFGVQINIRSEKDAVAISLKNITDVFRIFLMEVTKISKLANNGNLSERGDVNSFKGGYAIIIKALNSMLDSVIKPLEEERRILVQVAEGNIEELITETYQGDHEVMKQAVNNVGIAVQNLHGELRTIAMAVGNGKLSERGDTSKFKGAYAELVGGVNLILDELITPMDNAANYVARIANGDIPPKIEEEYFGDFNTLKNNINLCIDSLNMVISEMHEMHSMQKIGDYEVYIPIEKFNNAYKQMAVGYNEAVKLHVDNQMKMISVLKSYAEGNLNPQLEILPGKLGIVNEVLNILRNNIHNVVGELNILIEAGVNGNLSVRANAEQYQGAYHDIITGLNKVLDAITVPFTQAAAYIERISNGDIPDRITEEYKGNFNALKDNLNNLIGASNTIIVQAQQIAKGDLTLEMKPRSDKDDLLIAFGNMTTSIGLVIKEFRNVAGHISIASQQLQSTAESISQGANEQSATTEEVSASIEEISASVQQNNESANITERIVLKTVTDIEAGSILLTKTIDAMKSIASRISIIGEIATKTDMLAINAAIEAAHAGMQGKGFAVVSQEIRKLSEHSQEAAKEIDEFVSSSLGIANETGQILTRIVPEIRRTTQLVQEIAATSHEQNTNVSQVNFAVQSLAQTTQQYASVAEEMSASSEELSGQSIHLNDLISFFKVDKEETDVHKSIYNFLEQRSMANGEYSKKRIAMNLKPEGVNLKMSKNEAEFEKY